MCIFRVILMICFISWFSILLFKIIGVIKKCKNCMRKNDCIWSKHPFSIYRPTPCCLEDEERRRLKEKIEELD